MDHVFVYPCGDNLYVNLTNRCPNDCEFCIRRGNDTVEGNELWLDHEPSAQEVIDQLHTHVNWEQVPEIVFCGFGEPMERLDVLLEVAQYLKRHGKHTRVNTNGLANLIHGRDITPECRGCIDTISISLNASNAQAYDAVCHSIYGLQAYPALLDFAKKAALVVPHVMFSVVDTIGPAEIARCQELADACGIPLRVRAFIEEGQA